MKIRMNVRTTMVGARINVSTLSAVTYVPVEKDLFFRRINTAVRKVGQFYTFFAHWALDRAPTGPSLCSSPRMTLFYHNSSFKPAVFMGNDPLGQPCRMMK